MSVTILLVPEAGLPSTQPTDAEIAATAAALTEWVNVDVGPSWGQDWQGHYTVVALKRGVPVPVAGPRLWLCHLTATSSVSGALGYHQRDAAGNPELFVAVQDATTDGYAWSEVTSHELCETLVNRYVDAGILASYAPTGGAFYWVEACDPVEGQPAYLHRHNGVDYQVSNFCYPAYFVPGSKGPWDHRGVISAPFTPARGGQQAFFPVTNSQVVNSEGAVSPFTESIGIHLGVRRK